MPFLCERARSATWATLTSSPLPPPLLCLLRAIRRLGQVRGVDLYLLCFAVRWPCSEFLGHRLVKRLQCQDQLHYCENNHRDSMTCAHPQAFSLEEASKVRVIPKNGRGKGEIIPLDKKEVGQPAERRPSGRSSPDSGIQGTGLLVHLPARHLRLLSLVQCTCLSLRLTPSRHQDLHAYSVPV